jgi:hypothetical protein
MSGDIVSYVWDELKPSNDGSTDRAAICHYQYTESGDHASRHIMTRSQSIAQFSLAHITSVKEQQAGYLARNMHG